jgi:hypothetical protein
MYPNAEKHTKQMIGIEQILFSKLGIKSIDDPQAAERETYGPPRHGRMSRLMP